MAEIAGNLWEYNLTRVIVVDVTDDYRLMCAPMPSDFYPVLRDAWIPSHELARALSQSELVEGYLYDWHEAPIEGGGSWYVGVVAEEMTSATDVVVG